MFCFFRHVHPIKVTTAAGFHLFPFRTEQLSPPAPMVLRNSGRVGRRRLREPRRFLKGRLLRNSGRVGRRRLREPRRFLKGRSAGLLFVYASVAFLFMSRLPFCLCLKNLLSIPYISFESAFAGFLYIPYSYVPGPLIQILFYLMFLCCIFQGNTVCFETYVLRRSLFSSFSFFPSFFY